MSSPGKNLKRDKIIVFQKSDREAGVGEEGIIQRIDDQRRDFNIGDKPDRATLLVIIARIAEAVKRCCIAVVEFCQCSNVAQAGSIEIIPLTCLDQNLLFEALQKSLGVDPVPWEGDLLATGFQIHRHGKDDSTGDRTTGTLLAEIFECDVSAEAESHEKDPLVLFIFRCMPDYRVQVIRCAAVIEPQLSIHLFAATAEVPGDHIVALVEQCPGHAFDVGTLAVAFEPVRDYDQAVRVLCKPVEVEKIVVRRSYTLPRVVRQGYSSEERGKDRFQVGVKEKERREVILR